MLEVVGNAREHFVHMVEGFKRVAVRCPYVLRDVRIHIELPLGTWLEAHARLEEEPALNIRQHREVEAPDKVRKRLLEEIGRAHV